MSYLILNYVELKFTDVQDAERGIYLLLTSDSVPGVNWRGRAFYFWWLHNLLNHVWKFFWNYGGASLSPSNLVIILYRQAIGLSTATKEGIPNRPKCFCGHVQTEWKINWSIICQQQKSRAKVNVLSDFNLTNIQTMNHVLLPRKQISTHPPIYVPVLVPGLLHCMHTYY